MKIDRLDCHDRLEYLKKDQSLNISQGAQDCLQKNELSLALQEKSPYVYLFAHPRTADDGVTKVMYWDPRLSRPKAQTNSYLFRAQSKTDVIEVCWMLPPREQWANYKKGNVAEHELVLWSINQFENNRAELEKDDPRDIPDALGTKIYHQILSEHRQKLMMQRLWK
jgi:hypothetical protein